MIHRNLTPNLLDALSDTPVVFLAGARQTGKSTLAKAVATGPHPARYLTFDDPTVLAAARHDPAGFISGLDGPVVLDEIQQAPGLLPVLKAAVDRDPCPGRYLLTGSADVLAVPRMGEYLVGRMELLTLWPFTQGEQAGRAEGFIDALFGSTLPRWECPPSTRAELAGMICRGGYPGACRRKNPTRLTTWFDAYLTLLLQRDVRDLAHIEGLSELPRLQQLVAARTAGLLSHADLARDAGLPQTTFKRYLALLETLFLVHRLPAWTRGLSGRLVKAPNIFMADSGLAAHLLGADAESLREEAPAFGRLLETFAINELLRQVTWSRTRPGLFHYRTHTGREVDLVLEDRRGRCAAVEIKAGASPTARDTAGLRAFAEAAGERFLRGVLLYLGEEVIPLARNLHAVPISAIWRTGASEGR